jgi:hypothetical protein
MKDDKNISLTNPAQNTNQRMGKHKPLAPLSKDF